MKILFLGTPDFAVKPLIEILSLGSPFEVIGVVTNKDKPVGRKKVLTPPPVKVEALKNNLPVFQYDKIRLEGVEDLKKLNPDIIVTCAFGQILSQEILNIPKYGVINIHASLLPKYRGASPIQHAILNGEKETGVTIMQTVMEVDAGDILLQE
ncbi:MAG: methionyl-tRNA formyltransferase, partial [Clostridia bacterium]|nr:methionyl-tRNA formyltransferase [Clostridia bacterium]